jgi:hypothetical protein
MASCLNIVCDTSDQLATLAKVVGKMRHLRRLIGTMRHLAILTCNTVTGFVVDLAGKCVEGLHMNWAKYLVN